MTIIPSTPQEIFEYKQSWLPGVSVPMHSDLVDQGKTWCRKNLKRYQWSVTTWTAPYEHTFHFENQEAADAFAQSNGKL